MENLEQYNVGETDEVLICHGADEAQPVAASMLHQCERQLDILTHDFEPGIYDNLDCFEALENLVLEARRHARVRILIQRPEMIAQRGHHLLNLGRKLSTYIKMRCPAEQHRHVQQSFLIVDGIATLHRPYQDTHKWAANFKDLAHVSELERNFQMLWEESEDNPYLREVML